MATDFAASTTEDSAAFEAARLQLDRIGVWVLSEEDRALRCRYLLQRSSGELFQDVVLRSQDFPEYFAALFERRVIAASDALKSPLTHALYEAYLLPLGITGLLDVPLYLDGRAVGIVCHEHIGPPRLWTRAECDFAISVADNIARLYREHERRNTAATLAAHQQHMMELSRMEAVGRIAACVAHDFRSILGAARGFAELIRRVPQATPQIDHYAQRIIDALDRGEKLAREVTDFGKSEVITPRVLDPVALTQNACRMFRVLIGEHITLNYQAQERVSRIFMDPSQVERALLNLVLNARDAMPAGGQLQIEIKDACVYNDNDEAATYVAIAVSDTGAGMDDTTRLNAFKPFYSTKGEQGTGLGLAIVQQILQRAGGYARIDSEVGHGTTITIFIPRIASAATQCPDCSPQCDCGRAASAASTANCG